MRWQIVSRLIGAAICFTLDVNAETVHSSEIDRLRFQLISRLNGRRESAELGFLHTTAPSQNDNDVYLMRLYTLLHPLRKNPFGIGHVIQTGRFRRVG
jgi:hypothetical protein